MPGLITEARATGYRAKLARFLVHTYSLTTVTEGADDGYGGVRTEGATTTGRLCAYRQQRRLRLDEGDRVIVDTPTLAVAHDDTIAPGDLVSDVRDSTGALLLAGPATVETIEASAGLGPTLTKTAVLRASDVI